MGEKLPASTKGWYVVAGVVLVGSLLYTSFKPEDDGPSPAKREHRVSIETCDEDGATGTFTYSGDGEASYEVWIAGYDGDGAMVDRDVDYVLDIGAGQTERVSWVWVLDERPRCRVLEVTRR